MQHNKSWLQLGVEKAEGESLCCLQLCQSVGEDGDAG